MTNFIRKFCGLAILSTILAATVVRAEVPAGVRLRSISYAGSGCPQSSVSAYVTPGGEALQFSFDQYVAEVGPGIPLNLKRKNCQISLDIEYPAGWSFALTAFETRGYVMLERGVVLQQKTSQYSSGSASTASLKTTLQGPLNQEYRVRDELSPSSAVWSPCGVRRALNLNTQVVLDNSRNPRARGLYTLDEASIWTYGVAWKRCI